jgi:hypothetical protein
MIIQLRNMNIWLRKYPVEVWVTRHPNFRYHPLWVTSIGVAVHSRYRQRIAVQTRCRWSSRSLVVDVEEVVVCSLVVDVDEVVIRSRSFACRWRRGSSHSGASSRVKTLPKNLIARLSRVGSQQQGEVSEALLSPVLCTRCKRWRCKRKQQTEGEERGLQNRSTYSLWIVTLRERRRAPYIGEQQA